MTTTTAPLDRATLARRLLAWPGELAAAERHVLDTLAGLLEWRDTLQTAEDYLRRDTAPAALGANEAQREATIRGLTATQRHGLAGAEQAHREATSQLRCVEADGKCLRSLATLLGGEGA